MSVAYSRLHSIAKRTAKRLVAYSDRYDNDQALIMRNGWDARQLLPTQKKTKASPIGEASLDKPPGCDLLKRATRGRDGSKEKPPPFRVRVDQEKALCG